MEKWTLTCEGFSRAPKLQNSNKVCPNREPVQCFEVGVAAEGLDQFFTAEDLGSQQVQSVQTAHARSSGHQNPGVWLGRVGSSSAGRRASSSKEKHYLLGVRCNYLLALVFSKETPAISLHCIRSEREGARVVG